MALPKMHSEKFCNGIKWGGGERRHSNDNTNFVLYMILFSFILYTDSEAIRKSYIDAIRYSEDKIIYRIRD